MSAQSDLVTAFVAAWEHRDVDRILDFFTDDAVYINMPIDPPNQGKAAIRAVISEFIGMAEAMEFIIHHQGETSDGRVLNERTDRFKINGKWIDLPVMGIFEFRDGKICGWRDYFDMNRFTSQMGG